MTSQLQNNGIPDNSAGNGQAQPFDQPVILRQSPVWSQAIVWAILGVTSISILWAFLAQVEETIPAQGKLEPVGVVQPVQPPSGGVIEKIHVKEGDLVEKGDVLITFNQSAANAELESLLIIREQLANQTEVYRAENANGDGRVIPVSSDLQQRLEEKTALETSNQIYQAQIDGDTSGLSAEAAADVNSARGEAQERQIQNREQIKDLKGRLSQARAELRNAENDLNTNQEILERLTWLEKEGAVAELSRLQQEQEVSTRITRVSTLNDE